MVLAADAMLTLAVGWFCLAALDGGVPRVHIISGRAPFTLLRELFTAEGCGSLLLPDKD